MRPVSAMLQRVALGAALACGAAHAVDEAPLKAAIVYNLLQFAAWPADAVPPASAVLTLCVDPESALAAPLRLLQGRPVGEHRLEVLDLPSGEAVRRCHALFQDPASRATAAVRRHIGSAPVLVVSDEPRIDDAVIVHLMVSGGRVVFDVQLKPARRSGLLLSSKLLRLAREVRE
jgi:hypothetical protein